MIFARGARRSLLLSSLIWLVACSGPAPGPPADAIHADLVIINGTTVDTLYSQANIIGGVNLNSSQIEVIGGFIPQTGDTFTIINNDGTDPVTGTFSDFT